MKKVTFLIAVTGCAFATQAQVMQFVGEPSNQVFRLDFDDPFVSSGPIDGNAAPMTSNGISNISLVGTWTGFGDTVSAAANGSGQCLVSVGTRRFRDGLLAVSGIDEPLDNPTAGAGFDITLLEPASEFGVLFIDQINFDYTIELFRSGISIAPAETFRYAGSFPAPGHYWNEANGFVFDRILLTFPRAISGVGIDNITIGAAGTLCYADCDTSTGAGVLDLFDFLCFQDAFVAGEPYACDCDTSTGPVCDLFDFLCFQDAFVAGCP